MIAAVCSWHEDHERAVREIHNRLNRRQHMIVAAPALIEAFSVLTRFPTPHRISPNDALIILETNFVKDVKIIALSVAHYTALLRGAPEAGISGGRMYDAVIAACARRARVRTVLTFNETDFAPFADSTLEIAVP